jgi:hypothetical protein
MVTMFRSRQEARAVAKKLARHFPDNDYEAWPDQSGYWVLVVRYRDEHGHLRLKFVASEAAVTNRHCILDKNLGAREAVNAPP